MPPEVPSAVRTDVERRHRELDAFLAALHRASRRLPAALAQRDPAERDAMVGAAHRGDHVVPRLSAIEPRVEPAAFAAIDRARRVAEGLETEALYAARLDELELELALIDALGDPRRVR